MAFIRSSLSHLFFPSYCFLFVGDGDDGGGSGCGSNGGGSGNSGNSGGSGSGGGGSGDVSKGSDLIIGVVATEETWLEIGAIKKVRF